LLQNHSAQASVGDHQAGAESANEPAKPQAYGERESRNESPLNEPTAERPVAAARDVPRETATGDIGALLTQLDGDLRNLERELAELESLLKAHPSPTVARLAKQLRVEIGRLKQRRQILQVTSKTMSKIAHRD
jgi:hypothetical protein